MSAYPESPYFEGAEPGGGLQGSFSGNESPITSGTTGFAGRLDGEQRHRHRDLRMPPIERVSMAPRRFERNPLRRRFKRDTDRAAQEGTPAIGGSPGPSWRKTAARRRIVLWLLVLTQTAVASWSLARTFPWPERDYWEIAIVATFAVLFSWISFAFWTSVASFCMLWRRGKMTELNDDDGPLRTKTAVLMPICNEEVDRCFAGVEAMYRSLAEIGRLAYFDFFILSDSSAVAREAEEEAAWAATCQAVNGWGKIFYRRRRVNIKRKSGNIADFLRRWSCNYDYMIVLDADSLMTGAAMVRLARMMEGSPQVGIIQTLPAIVNGESLFARVQQFASRVYGPLFGASLHFWQLGESTYWGHNAILRIAPFVKHCALARLPGEAPLGGEILSHDFVEAALMGRAGYEVRLALDLSGSYEESPPNLLDELKRDRRWCQGNLQHLRVLAGDGLKTGHRAVFGMGVMAYVSALLWAAFLVLNTIYLASQSLSAPNYFSSEPSLFPIWPRWNPEWAIALASTTLLLLFLPKVLAFVLLVKHGASKAFGGPARLALGILSEIVFSTLLAPLRMWFHSKFVLLTLLGRTIKWNAQQRTASGTRWSEAFLAHAVSTFFALAWIMAVSWLNSTVFVWLLPVAIPLLLSIPLSVYSSRVTIGEAVRRWQLFQTPEEKSPPPIVAAARRSREARAPSAIPLKTCAENGSAAPSHSPDPEPRRPSAQIALAE